MSDAANPFDQYVKVEHNGLMGHNVACKITLSAEWKGVLVIQSTATEFATTIYPGQTWPYGVPTYTMVGMALLDEAGKEVGTAMLQVQVALVKLF